MILHPDSMKIHKHQGQYALDLSVHYFTSLFHFILHTLMDWSVQGITTFLKF